MSRANPRAKELSFQSCCFPVISNVRTTTLKWVQNQGSVESVRSAAGRRKVRYIMNRRRCQLTCCAGSRFIQDTFATSEERGLDLASSQKLWSQFQELDHNRIKCRLHQKCTYKCSEKKKVSAHSLFSELPPPPFFFRACYHINQVFSCGSR
jgi:hypothetical protein